METKEHLFFIPLILALYLPFVARIKLATTDRRAMVMAVAALVVLNSFRNRRGWCGHQLRRQGGITPSGYDRSSIMSTLLSKHGSSASGSLRQMSSMKLLPATRRCIWMGRGRSVAFQHLLSFVKDSYEPMNALMKAMTGHHWITHGLADVIVFVLVGGLLLARGSATSGLTKARSPPWWSRQSSLGAGWRVWFLFV